MLTDAGRNTIIGFCNAACDGRNGIAVTTQGNCITDGILKRGRFEECLQCLGNTALTGDVKSVLRTDVSQCEIHRIIVCIDIIPDFHHTATGSGHVYCNGGSFGTL